MIKFFVPEKSNLQGNKTEKLVQIQASYLLTDFNLGKEASCYFLRITNKAIIAFYQNLNSEYERKSFVDNMGGNLATSHVTGIPSRILFRHDRLMKDHLKALDLSLAGYQFRLLCVKGASCGHQFGGDD